MSEGFTVAIIGGGFAGSAVAFQLARLATPNLRILVFEPRPALGGGLAYSTVEPVHRVNVVAQRMSLVPDEPLDFAHWFAAAGGDDPEAVLPDGRVFPRRAAFGRYVSERLEPDLASGQISHIRAKVGQLARAARGWLVQSDRHPEVQADAVVLALGNPPPVAPVSLARGLAGAVGFIADPHKAGALEAIGKGDRVLVVGAGLTMADIVAALDRAGHCGAIHAISRRGQRSRGHAKEVIRPAETVIIPQARTALGLLGGVREALRLAQRRGEDWHVVFDAVRPFTQDIWKELPLAERQRLLRHLRPYWEAHRHRIAPQLEAVLARREAEGRFSTEAASIVSARRNSAGLAVTLRQRRDGALREQLFDAVIVTTGPAHGRAIAREPLLAGLAEAGWLTPCPTGLGLACNRRSRALDAFGVPQPDMFIAGPLARGTFGELTAVQEIARQAAEIVAATMELHRPKGPKVFAPLFSKSGNFLS